MITLTNEQKLVLFDFLGYKVKNNILVLKKTDKQQICPYTKEPVRFNEASVMPGSTVIFNTNALTLAEYFSEHVDNGGKICQSLNST